MTEDRWLSSSDPTGMLAHLRPRGEYQPPDEITGRRLRLFACACCRRVWHLIYPTPWHQLVELCEHYADRLVPYSDIERQRPAASEARDDGTFAVVAAMSIDQFMFKQADDCAGYCDQAVATNLASPAPTGEYVEDWEANRGREEPAQASLLRDIFGNPFRPVVFDPRWRSEAAVSLARTAYDTRNFDLLPILADALEEAGCDHADVLNHCRDPNGVHVRGCWVVDGVLGKV